MKKLILSLILLVSFTGIYAQKANVNKAKSKATAEIPDFEGAWELIRPALVDESTKDDATTWFVAGLIGYQQNNYLDKKAFEQGVDPDMKMKEKIVLESYNYLLKADSLDQLPNEKGKVKPKHRAEIKKMVKEYFMYNLMGIGANLFDQKQYSDAYNTFNKFLEIPDLPLMGNEIQKEDTVYNYTMIKYFTALAATNADMSNDAIRLYQELKNDNYEPVVVYQLLAEEYSKKKDNVNLEKTLEEGAQKFPQEPWFIQKLINNYIDKDENQKALDYVNTAIQRDPNSAEYRFVEGGLKETLGDVDGAIQSFKKVIELQPNMGKAYGELGRIHYNRAIEIGDASDKLKDMNKMKQEQAKALEEFKVALPYYQKAAQLEPNEKSYKVLLRTLYYRLKMDKEYEAIDKELENMQ